MMVIVDGTYCQCTSWQSKKLASSQWTLPQWFFLVQKTWKYEKHYFSVYPQKNGLLSSSRGRTPCVLSNGPRTALWWPHGAWGTCIHVSSWAPIHNIHPECHWKGESTLSWHVTGWGVLGCAGVHQSWSQGRSWHHCLFLETATTEWENHGKW